MRRDRWAVALDCGHEAPTPALGLPPRVGSYLSCPDKCLGGPKRVTAVRAVLRLLDLFCGAGGAAMGYHRAGFEVVGVDLVRQPRYPFAFVQADAMTYPLDGFDAIHASPVCLTFARVTAWRGDRGDHPDTLTPTLARLARVTVPWVVENVEEARLRADFLLCGSQFGLAVRRHRHFQAGNWASYGLMPPCDHRGLLPFMHKGERAYADAMGCTWMNKTEARQAIPPAYTEYIGGQLLEHLAAERAA